MTTKKEQIVRSQREAGQAVPGSVGQSAGTPAMRSPAQLRAILKRVAAKVPGSTPQIVASGAGVAQNGWANIGVKVGKSGR